MRFKPGKAIQGFLGSFILLAAGLCAPGLADNAIHPFYGISNLVMTDQEFSGWMGEHPEFGKLVSQGAEPGMIPVSMSDGEPIQAQIQKMSYFFGPGDVISIHVEGQPELSLENTRLNIDGVIALPLIGDVFFTDRDKDDVSAEITELLKEYLLDPKVQLVVTKPRPQYTYVLGAVNNAGPYKHFEELADSMLQNRREVYFSYDYHLATALEKAGGVLDNADLRNVHVFNKQLGYHKKVDLFALIVLGDIRQDLSMRPGDVVYVPRLTASAQTDSNITKLVANSKIGTRTFPVKVFGYVNNPNMYEMKPQEMTLQTALAKAGGPIAGIASDKVIVARTLADGTLKKVVVDIGDEEILLQPNDIVMVSNSRFVNKLERFVETLSNVIFRSSFSLYNSDRAFGIF